MSYRDQAIDWLRATTRRFAKRISEDFPLNASWSRMSDETLESYTLMLCNDIKKNRPEKPKLNPEEERVYLVPHMSADGSITLFDRISNRYVASVSPTSCGMPMYAGLTKYLVHLGGRGEYDTLVTRFADGDYVHDRMLRKKG